MLFFTTNDFLAQNATNLKHIVGCNSAENDTDIKHGENSFKNIPNSFQQFETMQNQRHASMFYRLHPKYNFCGT